MDSLPAEARELTDKMLGLDLWAVLHSPLVEWEQLEPTLAEHLRWMCELEAEGTLFASGPLIDTSGELPGRGLTILRAADFTEASNIANRDPFVVRGLRAIEVIQWRLMEGSINITINCSTRVASMS